MATTAANLWAALWAAGVPATPSAALTAQIKQLKAMLQQAVEKCDAVSLEGVVSATRIEAFDARVAAMVKHAPVQLMSIVTTVATMAQKNGAAAARAPPLVRVRAVRYGPDPEFVLPAVAGPAEPAAEPAAAVA